MSKTWLLPNGHARRSINYTTLCSICGFYRFSPAFGRVKTSNKLKINLMRIFQERVGRSFGAGSGKNDCKRQKSLGQANENVNLSGTHAFFPTILCAKRRSRRVQKSRGKMREKRGKPGEKRGKVNESRTSGRQTSSSEEKKGQKH